MKQILAVAAFLLSITISQAQTDTANGEMSVKSSVVCAMCKNTLETGLAYQSGVKVVRVDVDSNEIYVKFNPKKTSAHSIKKAINELGYVADDMKPSQEAYDGLHECCKAELGKH
jgi:copper chaperone CopZ